MVTVWAQFNQPGRIEVPLGDDDTFFSVVSAEEDGLFLFREVKNLETRKDRKWQVQYLDTALNVIWDNSYYVDLRYRVRGYGYYGGYFYLLYEEQTQFAKDMVVKRINALDRSSVLFTIQKPFAIELSEFEIVGNTLIFGGYANTRPTVICYKFGDAKPIVLPGFYSDRSTLLQVKTDNDLRIFNVMTGFITPDGKRSISLKSFNEDGELLKNINLRPSQDYGLLYGRVVNLTNNVHLVAGTYTRRKSTLSRGLFIARIDEDGEHIINYYNYADLKNFFSYMRAKREKRVKERIQRRKIKGKKSKFNYRLLVHRVLEKPGGEFLMVGEAFYPKYTHANYHTAPFGWSPVNDMGMVFEGYKYTHAVVVGFDQNGKLLWDNSFEINDVISWNLEQFVYASPQQDKTVLLYLYDNVLRSKIIDGSEVIEGKSFNDMKLSFEDDFIESSNDRYGGLNYWYGNTFYSFGVHTIKRERELGIRQNREVFFINKIRY
ncbi:MAG: hypothetical protein JJU28_15680 [Cyclobacteriaceae bacterium]|nr:hypothetical protein [Cyclobacteriaceae bacterium]